MSARAVWEKAHQFRVDYPQGETLTLASVPAAERPGPGPSPMDAIQAAVAGCTGIDIVLILGKMRKTLERLEIEVDAERRDEEPRIFTRLTLTYHVDGPDLTPESVRRAVTLSMDKYCSVSAMLKATVAFDHRIVLNGEALTAD